MALAAWLASSLRLRLVAAHAYAPAQSAATIPAASGVTVAHTKQLRDMAKRDAARVLERAEVVLGADVAVPRRLLVGEPAERLGEVAVREQAAMIVVGSRGTRTVRLRSAGVGLERPDRQGARAGGHRDRRHGLGRGAR